MLDAPDHLVVLDAGAYRALTRDLDASAARDVAHAVADAERGHDLRAVASPFALWTLLADVAAAAPAGSRATRGERAPSEETHARAGRARIALAACAVHCAKDPGAPGAHPFVLTDDPESRLCAALGMQPPPGLAAWNEYLASLAAEIAAEPTPERAQRLAAPLGHVAERARTTAEDYADEMQDAVLAAYDAASARWAWDDSTTDEARQEALATPLVIDARPVDESMEGSVGEPLMLDLLRRDPLLRAVAIGRAARAHRVVAGTATSERDADAEPTLGEAARVVETFPAGIALARELLRRIIAGDVEMVGRAARRWLWDLHVALGLRDEQGVAGASVLIGALGGVPGLESLAAYRARLGA